MTREKRAIKCRYYNDVPPRHTTTSAALVASLVVFTHTLQLTAEEDPLGPSPLLPLDVAWTTDLGDGPSHGAAYDAQHAYVPLRDGSLVAVALDTGEVVWSIEQSTDQAPVAGSGAVIVADGRHIHGLRAGDARWLWTRDLGAAIAAPLLLDTGWLIAALDNGELVTLRAFDGTELWRRDLDGTMTVRPSISGGRLFVPISEGRIAVLELATGSIIWERAITGSPQAILPLDALFVGSTDNFFYRLSLADGVEDWHWRTGGDIVGAPSVDADRVYFHALDNFLRALDRESGVRQWRRPLRGRPTGGPIRTGPLLVVSGVAPEILLFDARTGRPAGQYVAPGELAGSPYTLAGFPVAGPRMVLVTGDGQIVALTAAAGPAQLTLDFPPNPLLPHPERLTLADMADWFPTLEPIWPPITHARRFTVQIAAFLTVEAAERLASQMRTRGHPAYVVIGRRAESDGLHLVRVGRRLSHGDAARLAERLAREEGVGTWIVSGER